MSEQFASSPFGQAAEAFVVRTGPASSEVVVIRLGGELDLLGVDELQSALLQARARTVIVEVSALRFIDAAGIRSLLLAGDELARRGQHLEVRGASGIVRRVFDILGLAYLLAN